MNEHRWIQLLTKFQALCRGYLIRKSLSLIRTEFEDIVQEIDGGLDHLQWRGNILPKPHFTDTESLLLQYERSRFQSLECLSLREQKTEIEESEKSLPQSEIQEPERDQAPQHSAVGIDTSTPVNDVADRRGENLADDSTTLCNAMNSNIRHSSLIQTGPSFHSVFKDTAHTPDSLKQQRSTLAMELLWIQQAISSRKKYLSLKQRMDVSH